MACYLQHMALKPFVKITNTLFVRNRLTKKRFHPKPASTVLRRSLISRHGLATSGQAVKTVWLTDKDLPKKYRHAAIPCSTTIALTCIFVANVHLSMAFENINDSINSELDSSSSYACHQH